MSDQKKYPAYCRYCLDCIYYIKDNHNDEYKCVKFGFSNLVPYILNCNAD